MKGRSPLKGAFLAKGLPSCALRTLGGHTVCSVNKYLCVMGVPLCMGKLLEGGRAQVTGMVIESLWRVKYSLAFYISII